MGLLSSIGGILGIGGSSSSQTTTVGTTTETNVDVQNYIQNVIDTSGIESIIQSLRDLFAQSNADQKEINEKTALIFLAQAQSDAERNNSDIQKNQADVAKNIAQIQFYSNINGIFERLIKIAAISGGIYVLYRVFK